MIEEQQQIIVVTGVQGAGKSTIGRKLAESFKRGVFIEADALHRMIVSGGVWATDEGGPGVVVGESARQLRLRLKNACLLARDRASGTSTTQTLREVRTDAISERYGTSRPSPSPTLTSRLSHRSLYKTVSS